ncbi:SpoIIE family protein phosphatase [Actinosynnema sp. NPDC047251]|uniref:Putative transcriptional regulator n=1 Tax=Saccharothrix espanaensis (strain ATCC 51144 / DSM 44229 / JCM 9112 / NBRC 15066 / NRRL 15764) TaxID=1179773 RepID=K0K6L2_SACES|nr:SpoIIE family protein phosphatase [Saccharothrix espanaensis]CCH32203.1 putative transcriptional regulator [Saccharothrix espanaensis DSM 44229]
MTTPTGRGGGGQPEDQTSALPAEDAEELYDHAPCGHLSTTPDGRIVKVNATLLDWLGHDRADLVGRRRLSDLLSVGGRLYYETHLDPLVRMHGEVNGIALELVTAGGGRLPVLLTARVKNGPDGRPLLLRVTVFDARERRAYEQELLRARRDAERDRDQLRRLATTLQRTLLPPSLSAPPGTEVAAYYHHASPDEVGGDFYDLFPLAEDRWGLFLGDVCGKGAGAAAVTSLTRYTLRAAAVYDNDPAAVLGNLNAVLHHEYNGDDPRFSTVVFGLLAPDGDGYRLRLASGGHPPSLLLRADGTVEYLHTPGGQLVGILPDARFVTATTRLGPGDTLLLYTDGLTEARTGSGYERYEEEALHAFATGLAPTTAPALVAAVTDLLAGFGAGLEDDAAVLAVSVPAARS